MAHFLKTGSFKSRSAQSIRAIYSVASLKTLTREIVLSSIASSIAKHFPNRSIGAPELNMHFFFKPGDTLSKLSFTAEEA
jgi:hypothetical protein